MVNIGRVPALPENASTTLPKSDTESQYIVLVRYFNGKQIQYAAHPGSHCDLGFVFLLRIHTMKRMHEEAAIPVDPHARSLQHLRHAQCHVRSSSHISTAACAQNRLKRNQEPLLATPPHPNLCVPASQKLTSRHEL